MKTIIQAILSEVHRAKQQHPHWPNDYVHAAAIVCEESGELIRAALQNHYEDGAMESMREEAIQTAAMAIRFLEDIGLGDRGILRDTTKDEKRFGCFYYSDSMSTKCEMDGEIDNCEWAVWLDRDGKAKEDCPHWKRVETL